MFENKNEKFARVVWPKTRKYEVTTDARVPNLGVMLVDWGGKNGSTLTAGVIAYREGIAGVTKDKVQEAKCFGSLAQASTCRIGSLNGEEIYAPLKSLLPMVDPNDVVFGGWDISNMNLADAMARAKILDIDLQKQLRPFMQDMVLLPGIVANQGETANNIIKGSQKEKLQKIIQDIRDFKSKTKVDKVVVLWTANTEHYIDVILGLNDAKNGFQISPLTLYALACIKEDIPFINGSPQDTFAPGLIDFAIEKNRVIGGDFKSGQTKMKSVPVDFLVGAGIKVCNAKNMSNNFLRALISFKIYLTATIFDVLRISESLKGSIERLDISESNMVQRSIDPSPPLYLSLRIKSHVVYNCMIASGAGKTVMPKEVCDAIGLEYTTTTSKVFQLDGTTAKTVGAIKDLPMRLHRYPKILVVHEVIVVDVPPSFGMCLSRGFTAKLGGKRGYIPTDLKYIVVPHEDKMIKIYNEKCSPHHVERLTLKQS